MPLNWYLCKENKRSIRDAFILWLRTYIFQHCDSLAFVSILAYQGFWCFLWPKALQKYWKWQLFLTCTEEHKVSWSSQERGSFETRRSHACRREMSDEIRDWQTVKYHHLKRIKLILKQTLKSCVSMNHFEWSSEFCWCPETMCCMFMMMTKLCAWLICSKYTLVYALKHAGSWISHQSDVCQK